MIINGMSNWEFSGYRVYQNPRPSLCQARLPPPVANCTRPIGRSSSFPVVTSNICKVPASEPSLERLTATLPPSGEGTYQSIAWLRRPQPASPTQRGSTRPLLTVRIPPQSEPLKDGRTRCGSLQRYF